MTTPPEPPSHLTIGPRVTLFAVGLAVAVVTVGGTGGGLIPPFLTMVLSGCAGVLLAVVCLV